LETCFPFASSSATGSTAFPHARPAPFHIEERCRHAAHVDHLGLAEVNIRKRDAVLFKNTFQFLPAGTGETRCSVEFETCPDTVDHIVVETGLAQFAFLDRPYGRAATLRRVEPDGPCGSGLAQAGFLGVTAGCDGIEIVAVLPCYLDQDSLGVFRRNHLGFQSG
jgi:hypothetical protein